MAKNKASVQKTTDSKRQRKKRCYFCQEKIAYIDYKDAELLKRFISERAKIRGRRATGCCALHQRRLAVAIKNAREMMLLPYVQRAYSDRLISRLTAKEAPEYPYAEYEPEEEEGEEEIQEVPEQ